MRLLEAPRTMSNVSFTSRAVNGLPSCQVTPRRRRNVNFLPPSLQNQDEASSPIMVSWLSTALAGSK